MVQTIPIPKVVESELLEFSRKVTEYQAGLLAPAEFRKFRLTHGIYGQRQPDVYMVRTKIPYGGLDADQLRTLAEIAESYSNGVGHVTTRQDVQFYFVPLERVPLVMRLLAQVGLTTRQSSGNAVRNVTGCSRAGVCGSEAFDVSPYADAVFKHFLRNPVANSLPRKFKIAFSGCASDCAVGGINDVGLTAVTRGNNGTIERGFRAVIAGGLGSSPQGAQLLSEFVPVDELIPVCEAVVRVFDAFGNRKNRNLARLKFVLRKLGIEKLREEVWKVRATLPEKIPIDESLYSGSIEGPPATPPSPLAGTEPDSTSGEFATWRRTNVLPQKQEGYYVAFITLPQGDVTADQMRQLADLSEKYGNGKVRTDISQNFLLRWISGSDVFPLYRQLQEIGLAEPGARGLSDVVACRGADVCSRGITHPRALARILQERLQPRVTQKPNGWEGSSVRVSGCPNACGQHHIATIGLHGAVREVCDRELPTYQLFIGGGVDREGVQFSRQVTRVPARRVPDVIEAILDLYEGDLEEGETLAQFATRVPLQRVTTVLAPIVKAPVEPTDTEFFTDWGQSEPFKLEVGEGECGA